MYKVLNIGGEEYRLEYTVEASLHEDCVLSITSFIDKVNKAEEGGGFEEAIRGIASLPKTALSIFYAGLMQAHGNHLNGDGRVPNIEVAKSLVTQLLSENKGKELGNFYGILNMCVEQMAEDGFFDLIGVEATLNTTSSSKAKKSPKVPQDHKKKTSEN